MSTTEAVVDLEPTRGGTGLWGGKALHSVLTRNLGIQLFLPLLLRPPGIVVVEWGIRKRVGLK